MKVTIATKENSTYQVFENVDRDETISELRKKIEEATGASIADQTLIYAGKNLEYGNRKIFELAPYHTEITLHMVHKSEVLSLTKDEPSPIENYQPTSNKDDAKKIKITMQALTGQKTELECSTKDTVSDLMKRYQKEKNTLIDRLILKGNALESTDKKPISDYVNIYDGCTIYVMLKQSEISPSPQTTPDDAKQIKVEMRNLDGTAITLMCNPADTIGSIKQKYQDITGFLMEGTKIIMDMETIQDDEKPLRYYAKSDECTIHVVVGRIAPGARYADKPTIPVAEEISTCNRVLFWLPGSHPKKAITVGTGAGAGLGYLTLHENLGLLSLAVGAGAGLFITLVVGSLMRCAIPKTQWEAMKHEEQTACP